MIKMIALGFTLVFMLFLFCSLTDVVSTAKNKSQNNDAPIVKIITPKNNSRFDANTQVNYTITVSDKEDGESKYDEINTKEVLLEVKYIDYNFKITKALNQKVLNDPPGLKTIRTSNCFNCHAFNSKSIGPSFYDISKRYKATSENIALLVKHTREGSTGVWGKATMPTHTELAEAETKNLIVWILKNAASNTSYYTGTEGFFRLQHSAASQPAGAYLLTASYIDHGANNTSKQQLKGQDMIVIYSK
jgi:cytochrome c